MSAITTTTTAAANWANSGSAYFEGVVFVRPTALPLKSVPKKLPSLRELNRKMAATRKARHEDAVANCKQLTGKESF
jgi:hypothetical protein